jgi:glycosyltransferase involved in cell wall biosynthesis
VVHGAFQRDALAEVASMPVAHIDFPAPDLPPAPPARPPGQRVRLVTFGTVNAGKQVHAVIEALGSSELLRRSAEYTVVGECPLPDYAALLAELVRRYDVGDIVFLAGRLPDSSLYDVLHAADVVVNLRNPHAGEGSWSLLESLFLGKPTVVWPHGYYDEFPEGVVCKADSTQRLRSVLEGLCGDAALRAQIGRDARTYAQRRFDTRTYCDRFVAFAEECRAARPGLLFVDAVSERLREITPDPAAPIVDRVSDEINRLLGLA